MSKTAVDGFLRKVKEDQKLQDSLQKGAEGKPDPIGYIVKSAGGMGFAFTPKEFLQTQEGIQGQLTEEQLETVAGGVAPKGERIVSWTFHW
jgi:predicted ribosomally synthesized peptide with nif11-like leader